MPLISTWAIRVMVLVAIVAAVKIVITEYNHAISGIATAHQNQAQAEQALADATAEADKQKANAAESERLRLAAEKELANERRKGNKFQTDHAAAAAAQPEVAKWDDTPVPAAVRKLRRDRAAADPVNADGVQHPDVSPPTNAGAVVPRRDQRPAGGRDRGAGRLADAAASVQPR